ncbi:MAG: tRNA (guanosine(46)-N7)-methyltransferase TrmB [Bacilli bacterium]|nr:tRNA (guanosine(46)-N7)-methyltransferase TrmB [Bacilli bacterium]
MRLRNIKNKNELIENCEYLIEDASILKNNWQEEFGNNNPIHLEIGMGKGSFLLGMAKKYPNINFIGVERYTGVLARAINKINKEEITNLRVINIDAIKLNEVFDHEIDTIYLNFSDPWPKKRHAKRRLTSEDFLRVYDNLFKGDNLIIQKTDNVGLFESSIVSLSTYGYKIEDISLDLANTDKENVMTEYEEKFVNLGVKINYLYATKKR